MYSTRVAALLKALRLYAPATLSAEAVPSKVRGLVDSLAYVCHAILTALVRDRRFGEGDRAGFVPLSNRLMRRIIGHHRWQKVRLLALQSGLVECDGKYRAGVRALGYRLGPPHCDAPIVLRPISDGKLLARLWGWRHERERTEWARIRSGGTGIEPAVAEHLWRNLRRVRIDAEIGEQLAPQVAVAVEMIRHGDWFLKPDDYGRLHSNVTNLKRTLRQHLSVEGRRLLNLDLANSQPLFIAALLATHKKGATACSSLHQKSLYQREIPLSANVHYTDPGGREGGASSFHPLCRAHTAQRWCTQEVGDDVRSYLAHCEAGSFYEHVAERLPVNLARAAVKEQVFAVLFGPDGARTPVGRVLWADFPSVMQFVAGLKRPHHRHVAHITQRTESAFMFGRVVPRMQRERPDLFVATIHDSVMTTAGDEEYVRKVIVEEFEQLGVSPTVRLEA